MASNCRFEAKVNYYEKCARRKLVLCLMICVMSQSFASSNVFQARYDSWPPEDDYVQSQQNKNLNELFSRLTPQLTNMSVNSITSDKTSLTPMLQNSEYYLDMELQPKEQNFVIEVSRDFKNVSPIKRKRQLRKVSTRTIQSQQQQTNSGHALDLASLHKGPEAVVLTNKPLAYHLGAVSNGLYKLPFHIGNQLVAGPVYSDSKGDDDFATSYKHQLNRYYNQEMDAPVKTDRSEVLNETPLTITSNRCETVQTNVLLEKDDRDALTGDITRTCWANLRLSKCEGSCLSISRPTMRTLSGFHKTCYCCRESKMRKTMATLKDCSGKNGQRISSGPLSSMTIVVEEPEDCQCHNCS